MATIVVDDRSRPGFQAPRLTVLPEPGSRAGALLDAGCTRAPIRGLVRQRKARFVLNPLTVAGPFVPGVGAAIPAHKSR